MMSLDKPANSRACSTLKTSEAPRRARLSISIRPIYPAAVCQPAGRKLSMNRRAASPWPSNTSSTSNGSKSGIGTLHRVASTASRLAVTKALRCRKARRRISAQLSRSITGYAPQPARKQRRQALQWLIAVSQQRQLPVVFSQQGGETGDTQALCPSKIVAGGLAVLKAVEPGGERLAVETGLHGQFRQHTGLGDIAPLYIKSPLDPVQQDANLLWGQCARGYQGPARRLGIVNQSLGQTAFQVKRLTGRFVHGPPITQASCSPGIPHDLVLTAQPTEHHMGWHIN